MTSKLALRWLPCQAPGLIGSVLGLVGPVSVYCDWVRWKFGLQLLSQCGSTSNCLSRSVPEIHLHVAGTLSKKQTTALLYHLDLCYPIASLRDPTLACFHSQVSVIRHRYFDIPHRFLSPHGNIFSYTPTYVVQYWSVFSVTWSVVPNRYILFQIGLEGRVVRWLSRLLS